MILHERTEKTFGYDFDNCRAHDAVCCKCDYCGEEFNRSKRNITVGRAVIQKDSCSSCVVKKREESSLLKHGVKNAGGTAESIEKAKSTHLSRYGVENAFKLQEFKDKAKKTCQERYGVDTFLQTEECKRRAKENLEENKEDILKKMSDTCMERYGVSHYSKTEEAKSRKKKTSREKYGCDSPMQHLEVKRKLRESMTSKYGVEHALQVNDFLQKAKDTCKERYGEESYLRTQEGKDKIRNTVRERYGVDSPMQDPDCLRRALETRIERYGSINANFGKTQNEIRDFLNSLTNEPFAPDLSILEGKEIDLYNSRLKLGIEYCGLFWHTESSLEPRDRSYHFSKYSKCLEKGIRLITIFEDEWIYRREQCISFLKSVLGCYEIRVYARHCLVKEVTAKEFGEFCEKHHIQGKSPSTFRVGLFHGGELIGVMSLCKHHRGRNEIVLNRLCFKDGVQVVGGSSKLLAACSKWCAGKYDRIISWSDNRWSAGNVYEKMGFSFDVDLPPDYSYASLKKKGTRLSKQSCKKKDTGCPADKTEREWMAEKGFARIWDCGKKRWVKKI